MIYDAVQINGARFLCRSTLFRYTNPANLLRNKCISYSISSYAGIKNKSSED